MSVQSLRIGCIIRNPVYLPNVIEFNACVFGNFSIFFFLQFDDVVGADTTIDNNVNSSGSDGGSSSGCTGV